MFQMVLGCLGLVKNDTRHLFIKGATPKMLDTRRIP